MRVRSRPLFSPLQTSECFSSVLAFARGTLRARCVLLALANLKGHADGYSHIARPWARGYLSVSAAYVGPASCPLQSPILWSISFCDRELGGSKHVHVQ